MCNLDLLLCSRGHADDCSFSCLELNIVKFIQEFLLLISCPNGNVTVLSWKVNFDLKLT